MSMTFPAGGGENFANLPAGSHAAVCTMLADIGVQPGSKMYPDPKHQVVIRFEVPGERIEDQPDYTGGSKGPMTITARYTASMNSKAKLRALLEGWRGKKFTDVEASEFDVAKLLGVPCLLSVVEYTKNDGGTGTKIGGASPLVKGMAKPTPEGECLLYTPEDTGSFDKLPQWVQNAINDQIVGDKPKASSVADDDDIPF